MKVFHEECVSLMIVVDYNGNLNHSMIDSKDQYYQDNTVRTYVLTYIIDENILKVYQNVDLDISIKEISHGPSFSFLILKLIIILLGFSLLV